MGDLLEAVDGGGVADGNRGHGQEQDRRSRRQAAASEADGLDVGRVLGQELVEIEGVETEQGLERVPFHRSEDPVEELVGEVEQSSAGIGGHVLCE